MASSKPHNESHEALLREGDDISLHSSIDGDDYSNSVSDEEEAAAGQSNKIQKRRRRRQELLEAKDYLLKQKSNRNRSQCGNACGCLRPRTTCVVVTVILLSGFLTLIGGGGLWVYKTAPKDGQSPPWYPTPRGGSLGSWRDSYEKAQKMVEKMTLTEKVNITTGTGWQMGLCVGNTGPGKYVGFPSLCLQDGPLGIRFADHITAFPAGITMGATWNHDLMHRRGRAHGLEARLKGVNVLLGPAMGPLGRMPAGGRNWEGFGSDPVLQAIAAAETIRGIQDEGVMATAKHFIGNEQEHFRQSFEWGLPNAMSANIDDRTLHEVYAWPFAESVRAGVASVMCSYQMVNNSYACGNSKLMNGILKDELGFQGFVQSDWLAQRSGVASALAGLDMSMPGDGLFWANGDSLWGPHLTIAALNGSLSMERLNDMATRVVAAWYQLGQDHWPKPPPYGDGGPNFSSWTDEPEGLLHQGSDDNSTATVNKFLDVQREGKGSHRLLARLIAAEGTVLVKNEDSILPLHQNGSGTEDRKYRIGIFGEDAGSGRGPNACADRGCNQGTLASGWGSGAVEFPFLKDPWNALKNSFNSDRVSVLGYLSNSIADQLHKDLKDQDLCIVFVNSDAGEGFIASDGVRGDRNDLYLQKGGDKLVKAAAAGCGDGKGRTIVVVHAVGPVVVEEWIDLPEVKAVLLANLPGEESGSALADLLFGNVDASGRLLYTVGKSLEDYGPGGQVLYYPNGAIPQIDFTEGLYIDYRHFDKQGITPRYEFGFGLSYTTFEFSELSITLLKSKSALPTPRSGGIDPPSYDNKVPSNPSSAIFPPTFRKLRKYIYPYIESLDRVKPGRYRYPDGYNTPQVPSEAGGGQGGNPSLFENFVRVNILLTNTGLRTGQEVVQLYLSYPENVTEGASNDPIDFPVKVLRNFKKVELEASASQTISLHLTRKDLSYWSTVQQNWVMPAEGEFKVAVGRSSRDLPLVGAF